MKTIINILHWTPFGLITVPLFVIGCNKKSSEWLFINGFTMGAWLLLIYTLWQK